MTALDDPHCSLRRRGAGANSRCSLRYAPLLHLNRLVHHRGYPPNTPLAVRLWAVALKTKQNKSRHGKLTKEIPCLKFLICSWKVPFVGHVSERRKPAALLPPCRMAAELQHQVLMYRVSEANGSVIVRCGHALAERQRDRPAGSPAGRRLPKNNVEHCLDLKKRIVYNNKNKDSKNTIERGKTNVQ